MTHRVAARGATLTPTPTSIAGYCPAEPSYAHNHQLCTCPPCEESKEAWFRCYITEHFVLQHQITTRRRKQGVTPTGDSQ